MICLHTPGEVFKLVSEPWEPSYGFCAYNETDNVTLAKTLEAIRRMLCCYGGGSRCDCKYGLTVNEDLTPVEFGFVDSNGVGVNRFTAKYTVGNSEQVGCPELREVINRLLHRPESFVS